MNPKNWKIQLIPLSSLFVSNLNIRKNGVETNLEPLKVNIRKNGVFDPLTVKPASDGKYEIIKGQRRFLAISELAKIEPAFRQVPCIIVDYDDDEAILASISDDRLKYPVSEKDYVPVVIKFEKRWNKEEVARRCGLQDVEEVSYYLGRAIRTEPATVVQRKAVHVAQVKKKKSIGQQSF